MLIENSWNRVSCSGTLRTSIPSLICRHVWKVYEQAVNLKVCVYPLREKQLPVPQSLKYNQIFLTFPACFLIPIIFSNLNYNCSNLLDLRTLQSLTGPVQGSVVFPHREKPVFISWDPCNENRIFPVGNTTQGKPCSHYRDGFAVRTLSPLPPCP